MAEHSAEARMEGGASLAGAKVVQADPHSRLHGVALDVAELEAEEGREVDAVEDLQQNPGEEEEVALSEAVDHTEQRSKAKRKHGKQKYFELPSDNVQLDSEEEDERRQREEGAGAVAGHYTRTPAGVGITEEEMMMAYSLSETSQGPLAGLPQGRKQPEPEGMEMVELHDVHYDGDGSFEDDCGESGLKLSYGKGGIIYDSDEALAVSPKGLVRYLAQQMWWTLRRQHWSYFLLHDALPPLISYWSLWVFALGFMWGSLVQWLAFIPLFTASIACITKTAMVGRSTDWMEEGNAFVERLFGLTFPSVLFPLGLLLVHLKKLDVLDHASWPVVLIPFWTQYLLFLSFPAISIFFYFTFRRSLGTSAPYECSWFYIIKWPFLIPTIGFNMMLSVREDLPWAVAFLPMALALFSSLITCFYMHLPNTAEVERFMASADEDDILPSKIDAEKDIV